MSALQQAVMIDIDKDKENNINAKYTRPDIKKLLIFKLIILTINGIDVFYIIFGVYEFG